MRNMCVFQETVAMFVLNKNNSAQFLESMENKWDVGQT